MFLTNNSAPLRTGLGIPLGMERSWTTPDLQLSASALTRPPHKVAAALLIPCPGPQAITTVQSPPTLCSLGLVWRRRELVETFSSPSPWIKAVVLGFVKHSFYDRACSESLVEQKQLEQSPGFAGKALPEKVFCFCYSTMQCQNLYVQAAWCRGPVFLGGQIC